MVILDEVKANAALCVTIGPKGLKEKSSIISVDVRFDYYYTVQLGPNKLHSKSPGVGYVSQILPVAAVAHGGGNPLQVGSFDIAHSPGDLFQAGYL